MRPLLLALAALLAVPAVAQATYWSGKTEQGRLASVRTGADGMPSKVRIAWVADCRQPRMRFRTRTAFVRPLDVLAPYAFRDRGTYRIRLGDGLHSRTRVAVRGHISQNLRRWRGRFRGRARIYRNGRRIDTCRVTGVRWRAKLRG